MATKAHCAFCFESLSASFEDRQPLALAQVEELWEEYHASGQGDDDESAGKDQPVGQGGEEDEREDEDEEDAEMTDVEPDTTTQAARPAAISRLLNNDKSSAASSSSSSLQSSGSGSSSNKETPASRSNSSTPASSSTSLRSRISSAVGRKQHRSGDGEKKFPLFVTWNTVSRSGGEHGKSLRGCIGTFEPQGLESGLRSYALTSAFEDVRFSPIPSSLLPRLSVHITLLTNFSSPNTDPLAWTLGQHGLRISFNHRGRRLGATYLPDVASEQGWTPDETVASLMRKAGWNGGDWRRAWRDGRGKLITYEGKQCGLGYEEWRVWREWVVAKGVKSKALN